MDRSKRGPTAIGTEHPARVPFRFGVFAPRLSILVRAGKRPGKARPPWIPSTKPGVRRPAGLPGLFPVPQPQKKLPNEETHRRPLLKKKLCDLSLWSPYVKTTGTITYIGRRWSHQYAVCATQAVARVTHAPPCLGGRGFCSVRTTDRGSWRAK